jgi:hypothetical protein
MKRKIRKISKEQGRNGTNPFQVLKLWREGNGINLWAESCISNAAPGWGGVGRGGGRHTQWLDSEMDTSPPEAWHTWWNQQTKIWKLSPFSYLEHFLPRNVESRDQAATDTVRLIQSVQTLKQCLPLIWLEKCDLLITQQMVWRWLLIFKYALLRFHAYKHLWLDVKDHGA